MSVVSTGPPIESEDILVGLGRYVRPRGYGRSVHVYDLVIVGGGSGNMLPPEGFGDWKVAIIESDRMGGTCLNRGCIPSKCFVYTADVAQHIAHAKTFDIDAQLHAVDWRAVRDRVFARIDPLHESAVDYRRSTGTDVYLGEARFVGDRELEVSGEHIGAERLVVAAGSRPFVPEVEGMRDVDYRTSDDIMRIDELPASMVILGGGYIAAEMAHVFGSLGVDITIVNRSHTLLGSQDVDIAEAFTNIVGTRWDLRLGAQALTVNSTDGGIALRIEHGGRIDQVEAELLLVATGRVPNTDLLDVAAGGIDCDVHGHVVADEFGRTNVANVWTLGDVSNHYQLKHVANAEARAVWHNLVHPEHMRKPSLGVVPAAVFTYPQIASVGRTQGQLDDEDVAYISVTKSFGDTAYGWAMEDTTSFAKVLADPDTRLILGAHIIGPQASLLIQPLVQAMSLGNTVDEVARSVMYAHPALTEVVEQTLLEL